MASQFAAAVLAQVKNLVSSKLYRAFQILLEPCCDVDITDISFDCTAGVATITVTIDGISFPGSSQAILYSDDSVKGAATATYTPGSNTIVFTGFNLENGATNVTYTLALLFETSSQVVKGAFNTGSIVTDNPTCT